MAIYDTDKEMRETALQAPIIILKSGEDCQPL